MFAEENEAKNVFKKVTSRKESKRTFLPYPLYAHRLTIPCSEEIQGVCSRSSARSLSIARAVSVAIEDEEGWQEAGSIDAS